MTRTSMILGHRGWSAKYPENTRLAMQMALEFGADGLEFDVQLSADGVPVVFHDPTVDRTTDGTGTVAELSYDELSRLNAAAGWPSLQKQSIPTLEEVLDDAYRLSPGGLYNVELKVYDNWRDLVDNAASLVSKHPLRNNVLFSSFHHNALKYLKSRYPLAQIGFLYARTIIPPWFTASRFNGYSVNLKHSLINEDVVNRCHKKGLKVAVWTVDHPLDLKRMFQCGVDIVISNEIDTAQQVRDKAQEFVRTPIRAPIRSSIAK
jgi:glycerophosphoryl diester phosphodiesterase